MSETTGDGLDHLRIPFEKIKIGKKLEVEGYGSVFEGEFGDQRVALKKLNITNLANIKPKLLAEILTISGFRQHPNLVALVGFCDDKSNEIILVYEYVASGNLADKMRNRLTTIQRLEICLGAARGLDYLHTAGGIVHGNIKLSKILLNSNSSNDHKKFEAKVSSFGLSKIVPGSRALESSSVTTEKVSADDDVYSFGVVLLQVLCGVSELVDTDDYQERHVTQLVPKKMQQNKLQKIVHLDIRKEIKMESLQTYAKIACQCVMEHPDARPNMARVVEELQKALRLQGGEVTYVQIPDSRNFAGATSKDNGSSGVTVESNIQPAANDMSTAEEDVAAREDNGGDEVGTISELEETNNVESVAKISHIEDAKDENDPATTKEIFNSKKESNITAENQEENKSDIPLTDAHNQMNTTDHETTEETTDDLDLDKKSATTTESSNHDTSASTNQEVQDSEILKSDRGNCNELNHEEELEHLRIPFEKIKFGKKVDVRGYGSVFEGEFNHQQVALKRLNVTNLGNIRPTLLSAILNVSRFRQHPNLVALIGFCDENNKEIILVYEYVSGGNLADKMSKHLTTIQRLQICLGAARGLEYLHTGVNSVDSNLSIIHSDLKLSKILLNSDPVSSEFEAKVSGFGLPKLLPGHVEIGRKSMDPVHVATGKLTKESDVYSFGVLLLEVLCGVPELVDTDDYQERHVTELVPKRLEQNMLRKIIHFDIRDEITTESLETYAKIACRCVLKTPEERPVMSEVVEELEKALRLQGGKVSDVHIFYGSSNGNGPPKVPIGEEDHEGDDNGETKKSLNITNEESMVTERTIDDINVLGQSSPVPILGSSNNNENVPEDAEKENDDNINVRKSTGEVTVDQKSSEESKTIEENEVNNESKITTSSSKSDNLDDSNCTMFLMQSEKVSDAKLLASSNGDGLPEVPVGEDGQEGDDNGEKMSSNKTESKVTKEPTEDIAQGSNDVENIQEDVEKAKGDNINTPELKEEMVVDLNPTKESKINGENEVNNDSKITKSPSNSDMQEYGFPLLDERSDYEDATKAKDYVLMMKTQNPHMKEIMEVQNSVILDEDAKAGFLNTEKPELIVNIDRGFSNSATQTQESKSKRSNSTCSESSNGDDTAPSDYLLPKSPDNLKIRSNSSRNYGCGCFCCSWWQFICDKVVLYGGQFWNKLVSCFTWITGQCSSKKD
ncbi:hypothetical protein SSX86_021534 [Deinandra increscens subsp. villosa]|uniref:Protein kinase domain-containing protein n=1 Tax=Deinandra increscens subsp. villosa TaxID=3103831 RepID=A0AAP0CUI8_9ASTR